MRTIPVSCNDNGTVGWKDTYRYSKVRPLVITRSVEDDPKSPRYVITHTGSGCRLTCLPTLKAAYHALWLLLPLGNWRLPKEALTPDTALLHRCRAAVEPLGAEIRSR